MVNFRGICIICLLISLQYSCNKEDVATIKLEGVIQKGPFIQGSEVRIQRLNNEFKPTGEVYFTQTLNDFGEFLLETPLPGGVYDVATEGFYFNEIRGELSDAPIHLKALVSTDEGNQVNINVLTTLAVERIKFLIKNNGLNLREAKSQSQQEVLRVFGIEILDQDQSFEHLDISSSSAGGSILLAISCILQQDNSEGELAELVSKIAFDLAPDGELNNGLLRDEIRANTIKVNVPTIINNLKTRFAPLWD